MVFQHSVLPPLHARAGEKAMRLRRKARWFKLGWGIGRLIGGMHHTCEASHPTVLPTAERCPHASGSGHSLHVAAPTRSPSRTPPGVDRPAPSPLSPGSRAVPPPHPRYIPAARSWLSVHVAGLYSTSV